MVGLLAEIGTDPRPLIEEAGIDPAVLDNPEATISGQQELVFQMAYARCTAHRPGFWMQTGLRYRLMSYGPLGLAVLAANNVREGLEVLSAFQALTFSLMHYQVSEDPDGTIALVADDTRAPLDHRRFMNERALGSATMFLNDMVQAKFPLQRIESSLDYAPGWQDCNRVLGTVVEFGKPRTRWVFEPGIAQAPLPMASPLLEQTYQKLCSKLIDESKDRDPIVRHVFDLMVRSGRGFPTAAKLADMIGVSERTLHRRLDGAGTSFGRILEDIRMQRGRELLTSSNLSVEVIAEMLGFSETSSFSRFFKRMSGCSPAAFRRGVR